jgi:hypothetical protein
MRDFGFWVRIVAITQLFSLVLANYGEGWLAHDNPVLNLGEKPAAAPSPAEPAAKAAPRAGDPDEETGPGTWQEQYGAGWGGFEAPEMEPVAPEQPEYVRNGSLEPDQSMWAGEGD